MDTIGKIKAQVEQLANGRTHEVILKVLEGEGNTACPAHKALLYDYICAAIDRTWERRADHREGRWADVERAEENHQRAQENYRRSVFTCGCSDRYDKRFAEEAVSVVGVTSTGVTFS